MLGPHKVTWFPTEETPNIGNWLRDRFQAHPGWKIVPNGDGSYSHVPEEKVEVPEWLTNEEVEPPYPLLRCTHCKKLFSDHEIHICRDKAEAS